MPLCCGNSSALCSYVTNRFLCRRPLFGFHGAQGTKTSTCHACWRIPAGTLPDARASSNQVHNVHPASTGSGNTAGYNRTASQRGPNASPLSFPSLLRNQGGAYASAFGAAGALPKSLALISCLPALKTLTPPSMDWLRSFFADLRPQQRHVSNYRFLLSAFHSEDICSMSVEARLRHYNCCF
jgi:hypothetical protein